MSDTILLPNRQLAAALLSPVRLVLTVVMGMAALLLAFWCLCLWLYFSAWHRDTAALASLFDAALRDIAPGRPLAHMGRVAQELTQWLHQTLFVATGLESMAQDPTPAAAASELNRSLGRVIGVTAPVFQVVFVATQVFGVRLAMLVGMLPLLGLLYLVAHADGRAERAIRRACAGRESASVYHRTKYFQYALVGSFLITTLCLPLHVNPVLTMVGFALGITVLARVQWTYYKKYI